MSLSILHSGQKKHSVAIAGLRKEIKAEVKAREALGDETSASFVTVNERLDGDTKRLDKMEARLDRMQDELRIGADQVLVSSHVTDTTPRTNDNRHHTPSSSDITRHHTTNDADADQVLVAEAGDGAEGDDDHLTTLTAVLKRLESSRTEHSVKIEASRKTLKEHTSSLTTKAKLETEALADNNREWLVKIQKTLDANADVDLMDLRLKQDQLTETLEDVSIELSEKTSRDEVDDKLNTKFDELTDSLSTALQAVQNDDKDFKECIRKCEDGMEALKVSKSDKSEIADLSAQLTAKLNMVQQTASAAVVPPEVANEIAQCLRRDELIAMLDDKANADMVGGRPLARSDGGREGPDAGYAFFLSSG